MPTNRLAAYVGLTGVSCMAAGTCTAVGTYPTASGQQGVLVETWNGSVWRVQPTPDPTDAAESVLNNVSCPSLTVVERFVNRGKIAAHGGFWGASYQGV
jgi:hypothetical protein